VDDEVEQVILGYLLAQAWEHQQGALRSMGFMRQAVLLD
jgi:hypothetical protein